MSRAVDRAWLRYLHAEGSDFARFLGAPDKARFVAGWEAHEGLREVKFLSLEERELLLGPFNPDRALVAKKRRHR